MNIKTYPRLFALEENPGLSRAGMNSSKKTSSLGKTSVFRPRKMLFLSVISVIIVGFFFSASKANAVTQGPKYPLTTAVDTSSGSVNWLTLSNISADDAIDAAPDMPPSTTSYIAKLTNFGFSIPVGATINGISVEYEGYAGPDVRVNSFRLVKAGSYSGSVVGANNTPASGVNTYGSSSDLWGTTWTASDINGSNFGIGIQFKNIHTVYYEAINIDYLRITVYYTPAASTPTVTPTPTMTPTPTPVPTCGRTYAYMIRGVNASGSSANSNIVTGMTSACAVAPTIASPTSSSVTYNSATLGANVTSDGGATITARGICWSTSTTSPSLTTGTCVSTTGTTGIYTKSVTGLPSSSRVYYRGYATNSAGTSYTTNGIYIDTPAAPTPTPSCTNGYLDNDYDGYGAYGCYTSGHIISSASGSDCYDGNANAYSGSAYWSTINRGDGYYDYNCDGYGDAVPSNYFIYWDSSCVRASTYGAVGYNGYSPTSTGFCPAQFTVFTSGINNYVAGSSCFNGMGTVYNSTTTIFGYYVYLCQNMTGSTYYR